MIIETELVNVLKMIEAAERNYITTIEVSTEALKTLVQIAIKNEKSKIIFHDGAFGVQFGFSTDYFKSLIAWDDIEIIGTIHDQKAEASNE